MVYISILIPCIIIIAGLIFIIKKERSISKKKYKYNSSFSDDYDKNGVPFINASIGELKLKALLDSGATVNCMSKSLFDKLNIDISSGETDSLIGINSNDDKVYVHKIKFVIADLEYEEEFFIQEIPFECDMLLGSPFFYKYRWVVDFDEMVIRY